MSRTDPTDSAENIFTRLFQTSLRDLRIYLRRMLQNEADADEIAQEALLRVWGKRNAVPPEAVRPFLFRVAANLALDNMRTRRRWQTAELDESLPDLASVSAERTLAARQELAVIQHEIEALPPACRTAFLRCRVEGRSHAEIAADMGISKSMVEKHVAEAVFRLSRARSRR